jgi:hypothetical protein
MLYLTYHWETDQDPIQITLLCYGITVVFGYLWKDPDLTQPPMKALQLNVTPDSVLDVLRHFNNTSFYHDTPETLLMFDQAALLLSLSVVCQPFSTFIPHELWDLNANQPIHQEEEIVLFEKKILMELSTPETITEMNPQTVLRKAEILESRLSHIYQTMRQSMANRTIEDRKVVRREGYYHSKSSEAWSMMNHFYLGSKKNNK